MLELDDKHLCGTFGGDYYSDLAVESSGDELLLTVSSHEASFEQVILLDKNSATQLKEYLENWLKNQL